MVKRGIFVGLLFLGTGLLLGVVGNRFAEVFESMNVPLPWGSARVASMGRTVADYPWAFGIASLLATIGLAKKAAPALTMTLIGFVLFWVFCLLYMYTPLRG